MSKLNVITTNNIIILITVALILAFLFSKKIRVSPTWRATVTPLASIIGSGFLVSAPLLLLTTGEWALFAMIGIILVGYALGASVRYNIQYLEPLLQSSNPGLVSHVESVSRLVLGIAYVISVSFYLKLLSAFALRGFGILNPTLENMLTTAILIAIGLTGFKKGLSLLEMFEVYSVNTKIAIILALIVGHFVFNVDLFLKNEWVLKIYPHHSLIIALKKLLGTLLIIQGFETSRFMGHAYSAAHRIRTMRYAQWLAAAIYSLFIATTMVAFNDIHTIGETVVIDLCRMIAPVLPFLLIIAAVMSQFSAAVADTIGSGGLLSESFKGKLTVNQSYLIITVIAILLIWSTNIYQIIVIASKAFALYYGLQCTNSIILLAKHTIRFKQAAQIIGFVLLIGLMLCVMLFGQPIK